jgi:GTP cyclohydrolase I
MVAFSTVSSALELERMELADDTLEKMQEAVKTLIHGVGEDPSREGLLETPRVSKFTCID